MSVYPITGELYAAGYRWREEFASQDAVEANGGALQGGAAVGSGGVDLDGSAGWVRYGEHTPLHVTSRSWWLHCEFTPDFASAEAVSRFLFSTELGAGKRCYVARHSSGALRVACGDVIVLDVALGAWQAHWAQGDRNTLCALINSGANTLWLNGVQVATSATTWTMTDLPSELALGADDPAGAAAYWSGTIRRLVFGHGALEQADVDALDGDSLVSALLPSRYLVCVTGDALEVVGGDTVTRCTGTAGIRRAVLGAGAAQPTGPDKRLFGFAGGTETITLPNSEALQFTDGAVDIPFTVALILVLGSPPVVASSVITKASGPFAGEWYVFMNSSGYLFFRIIDDTAGAVIGRRTDALAPTTVREPTTACGSICAASALTSPTAALASTPGCGGPRPMSCWGDRSRGRGGGAWGCRSYGATSWQARCRPR